MSNPNPKSILNKATILFRDQLFSRKSTSSNVFLIVEHSNMIGNKLFVIVVSIFLREALFFIFTCWLPTLSLTTIQPNLKNIISLNQRVIKTASISRLIHFSCYPESKKNCPSRYRCLLQFHSIWVFLYTYINISCHLPTLLKMTDK